MKRAVTTLYSIDNLALNQILFVSLELRLQRDLGLHVIFTTAVKLVNLRESKSVVPSTYI